MLVRSAQLLVAVLPFCFCDILVINRETNVTEKDFIDVELNSASPVPADGVMGLLDLATPLDGCLPMSRPPGNLTSKWFALIRRKKCSLEEKVLNAERAGYAAAIIYNVGINSHFSENSDMPRDPKISIPGVLIGSDDGRRLAEEFLYSKNYMLVIVPESSFNLSSYLLPFAIVIGVCFIIMLLFMVGKCIKDRRRAMRNRLSSRHLKHLLVTQFKKGDRYEVCAVCLEEYSEGEKLRILPCSHAYHTKCIDPWLTNNRRNCPICKRKVAIEGWTRDSDDDSDSEEPSERTPLLSEDNSQASGSGQAVPVVPPNNEPQVDNESRSRFRFLRSFLRKNEEEGASTQGYGSIVSPSHSINFEESQASTSSSESVERRTNELVV